MVTVYIVVTYHRYSCEDLVEAFGSEAEAHAHVLDYAEEFWDEERLGPMPSTYDELRRAWDEHDLWQSYESRWEFEVRQVNVPDLHEAAPV